MTLSTTKNPLLVKLASLTTAKYTWMRIQGVGKTQWQSTGLERSKDCFSFCFTHTHTCTEMDTHTHAQKWTHTHAHTWAHTLFCAFYKNFPLLFIIIVRKKKI